MTGRPKRRGPRAVRCAGCGRLIRGPGPPGIHLCPRCWEDFKREL